MARRLDPEEELEIGETRRQFVDEEEYYEENEEEETTDIENEDDDPEPEYEDYGPSYVDEDED
jgi:hypothetical protein